MVISCNDMIFVDTLKYEIMMGDPDEMAGKKIKDLAEAVYKASGIPVHKQKLIYRGKEYQPYTVIFPV